MQPLPAAPLLGAGEAAIITTASKLSAVQRAKAIKRRKEIWEAMRPNSGATCATIREKAGRPQEFAADTASASGESKAQVNRHLARADALGDDLDEVVGTSLDKGVCQSHHLRHAPAILPA